MYSDYWYSEVIKARTAELADIAAMDRMARNLAPESSLRRYGEGLGRDGLLTSLSRWMHRRRHVGHAA